MYEHISMGEDRGLEDKEEASGRQGRRSGRKPMSAADREIAGDFVRLSREALKERDRERLIDLLMERGRLTFDAQTSGSRLGLPLDELKECLEREVDLLSRLEYERHKLLVQMEDLSKSMNAVHRYRAKFPFPPMPAFFDTTT